MPKFRVTLKKTVVYEVDAEDKNAAMDAVHEDSAEVISEETGTVDMVTDVVELDS